MLGTLPVIVVVFIVTTAFAAAPIGAVSSMGPLELSGARIAGPSAASYPIVSGDVIATKDLPAVVFLKDKSRITIKPNSKVKLEKQGDRTDVRLLEGSLLYNLTSAAAASFWVANRPFATGSNLQGNVALPGVSAPSASVPVRFGTDRATAARTPVPSNVTPF